MKRGIFFVLAIILLSYVVISEETQTGVILSAGDNVTVGGRGIKYMYGDTTQAIFKVDGYFVRAVINQNKTFHGVRLFVTESYGTFAILDITAYHICGDNTCASDEFCCRDCGCSNITGVSCVNNMCMKNNTFFDIQEYVNSTENIPPVVDVTPIINQTNVTAPENTTNITNTNKTEFKSRVNFDFLKDSNTKYVMMIIFAVIILVFIKFELTNKKNAQEMIEQRTKIKNQPVTTQAPPENTNTSSEITKEPSKEPEKK
jgi:hypothetical protein